MIELTYGVSAFVTTAFYIAHRWRRRGLGDPILWFLLSAIIFVFVGFFVNALEVSGGLGGWAYTGLIVVSTGLLASVVGSILAGALVRAMQDGRQRPLAKLAAVPVAVSDRRLIVVAALSLGPAWLYFALLGYIPLFSGIGAVASDGIVGLGELQASRLSRDGYASALGVHIPGQGLMQLMRNIGAPMAAAYAAALISRNGPAPVRIVILALSATTVLLAGQRWPLVYLGIAVVAGMAIAGARMPVGRLIRLAVPVLLIGVFVSVLQRRTLSTIDGWWGAIAFGAQNLYERIFFEQSIVPILSYQEGTYAAGSLLGRSYMDSLAAYAPGPGQSFPVEFYQNVTHDSSGYTAAPDFYTEAYINFGHLGVVLVPVVWMMILRLYGEVEIGDDRMLGAGIGGGLVAVLAQSAYTGPVFTVGGVMIAIFLWFGAVLLVPKPPTELNSPPTIAKAIGRGGR